MGYVIFGALVAVITWGIRSGAYVAFGGHVSRQREPLLFWAGIAFMVFMAIASLWLQLAGKW